MCNHGAGYAGSNLRGNGFGGLVTFSIVVSLVCVGCAIHRVREDVPLPQATPESFSETGAVQPPDRWWEAFDDKALNSMIEQALAANLDLRSAWARLDQARALAGAAGSGLSPQLDLGAGASRYRTTTGDLGWTDNRFLIDLSAGYEVDLWQRIVSGRNAADLEALATREDLEALALMLTAQVADTWYSIVEHLAHLDLIREQLNVSGTLLELVELRFSQGQVSAVDVYQQREQVASLEAQIPVYQSRLQVEMHMLAVLLGRPPTGRLPFERRDLPDLPPLPKLGVPAQLLQRRPDVRAAQARVVAADYRVGAALADRFPSLRIAASQTRQGNEIATIFDSWIWSVAGNLLAPLVDGGRREAEVDRSRAALRQAVADYEKTVLESLQEVEDALVRERLQREYLAQVNRELDLARAALRESRQRYAAGLIPYLTVLTELQAVQRIEREIVAAKKELISFRIELYKAMGGAWTSALEPDSP